MRENYNELLQECLEQIEYCNQSMRGYEKETTIAVIHLILANFKVIYYND